MSLPRTSIYSIRAALVSLSVGVGIGAWMLAAKGRWLPWPPPHARQLHAEVLGWGWLGLLVLGFSVWIFPKQGRTRLRMWAANGALVLWIAALPLSSLDQGMSALTRCAAIMLLMAHLWPRIKAFGS